MFIGEWQPDERDIEVLIPIVGDRETAIRCLRALDQRQRDDLRKGGTDISWKKGKEPWMKSPEGGTISDRR